MNLSAFQSFQRYRPEIRFADIDAVGIVNNAVYPTYFEQCRIHLFEGFVGREWNWNDAGMVVARHEIDYMRPIAMNDEVVIVTWIDSIGSKSMVAAYEVYVMRRGEWKLASKAQTVMVSYDHVNHCSTKWPESWIEILKKLGLGKPE